jgi:alkylated DNA repair dioxygenase AlkB
VLNKGVPCQLPGTASAANKQLRMKNFLITKKKSQSLDIIESYEGTKSFLTSDVTELICLLNFPGCLMGWPPFDCMQLLSDGRDAGGADFTMDISRGYSFLQFKDKTAANDFFQQFNEKKVGKVKCLLASFASEIPKNYMKLVHSTLTDPHRVFQAIPGLILIPDFISEQEEQELIEKVDASNWTRLKERSVCHYGHIFSYQTRRAETTPQVEPIPDYMSFLLERIAKHSSLHFNQLTINDYRYDETPIPHIAPHVDTHSAFHEAIPVISLHGDTVMDFEKEDCTSVFIPRRSLFIMTGDARYGFTHGIRQRKTDCIGGKISPRLRRISLTFRSCKWTRECSCRYPNQCDV